MAPNLELLWKAYPLHPTGERLAETNERPFVPPTTGVIKAVRPSSDRDLGSIFRPALLYVLFAALITPIVLNVLFRLFPARFSGGRLLASSLIGGMVAAEVLYGYAIYTLLVPLLL